MDPATAPSALRSSRPSPPERREFESIAVVGGKDGVVTDIFPPCGVCRQVMQEFCAPDFMIYMGRGDDSYEAVPLEQLLPYGFNAAKYMSAK